MKDTGNFLEEEENQRFLGQIDDILTSNTHNIEGIFNYKNSSLVSWFYLELLRKEEF